MRNEMTFEELRDLLLYRKIVKWYDDIIILDNGVEISIEETVRECCASAGGRFTNVVLDAAITNVSDIICHSWSDEDTYGCSAKVTIWHNRNIICEAIGDANAGNGGYYYSIASFIVKIPNIDKKICHFVEAGDGDAE